jgi:hypothetical protein
MPNFGFANDFEIGPELPGAQKKPFGVLMTEKLSHVWPLGSVKFMAWAALIPLPKSTVAKPAIAPRAGVIPSEPVSPANAPNR